MSYLVYRRDIDGLRAIAVGSVVLFHAFPDYVFGGFVGVDIFFVISGYLISGIIFSEIENNNFSFSEFYSRRIRRIFPALITILIFCFGAGWLIMLPEEFDLLGKHLSASSTFVSNFVFWKEASYFDQPNELKPLLHLWSLSVEEQFYLAFPFLLWLWNKLKLSFLPFLALTTLVSFILNIGFTQAEGATAFYLLPFRFWELGLGGLLAYLHISRHLDLKPNMKSYCSIIGISLVLGSFFIINKFVEFPGWWALMPTVGSLLIIAAGSEAPWNSLIFGNRFAVYVGKISYPLYLWHWSLLAILHLAYSYHDSPWTRLSVVGASFVLASLTYHFIESPIRTRGISPLRTAILLGLIVTLGFLGWTTQRNKGFPSRLPAFLNEMEILSELEDQQSRTMGRLGKCWLWQSDPPAGYNESCVEKGNQPLVVLWGDSHAAMIYVGLKELQKTRSFRIAQFTRNGCPPLVEIDANYCKKNNEFVIAKIRELNPQTIILFSAWNRMINWEEKLIQTVKGLKDLGVNILVIGPPPQWKVSLKRSIFDYSRQHYFTDQIPERIAVGSVEAAKEADKSLEQLSKNLGVNYFSPLKNLCTESGCLAYITKFPNFLTSWDYGHFTKAAAIHVCSLLPPFS